jgi:hypothetical protein
MRSVQNRLPVLQRSATMIQAAGAPRSIHQPMGDTAVLLTVAKTGFCNEFAEREGSVRSSGMKSALNQSRSQQGLC